MDVLKASLTTTAGWVSIIQIVVKGIEYFTPDNIDVAISSVADPISALIISGGALYHLVRAGKTTQKAAA